MESAFPLLRLYRFIRKTGANRQSVYWSTRSHVTKLNRRFAVYICGDIMFRGKGAAAEWIVRSFGANRVAFYERQYVAAQSCPIE